MEKAITSPVVETIIKKACFSDGKIVIFPDRENVLKTPPISVVKMMFGEGATFTIDSMMGYPCWVIENANFFLLDSVSVNADIEMRLDP